MYLFPTQHQYNYVKYPAEIEKKLCLCVQCTCITIIKLRSNIELNTKFPSVWTIKLVRSLNASF